MAPLDEPDPAEAGVLAHRTVEVDRLPVHLVQAGPEGGPPVVLLHGFPEAWFGWQRQIPRLADAGFRVTAPDQRGYNLSGKPRGVRAYGLDRLSRDVVELVDLLGEERVLLAGHDWGAAVAWWTAVRYPQRVERLAVFNVPHPLVMRKHLRTNPRQRRRSWYIFLFQLPWLPEWMLRRRDFRRLRRALTSIALPGTFSEADLARYRDAWARPRAVRTMVHWYRAALWRPPARVASPRVTVPTRIFWGLDDPALGAEMVEPSVALCDRADAVRLPGLTHWLLHEAPAETAQGLIRFFAGRGA